VEFGSGLDPCASISIAVNVHKSLYSPNRTADDNLTEAILQTPTTTSWKISAVCERTNMSTEVVADTAVLIEPPEGDDARLEGLSPPPESNGALKLDGSDSELSDIEDPEEEDIGEIVPDHYECGVPIFKPTMDQFKNFQHYVSPP
jgi:hypothetical protein